MRSRGEKRKGRARGKGKFWNGLERKEREKKKKWDQRKKGEKNLLDMYCTVQYISGKINSEPKKNIKKKLGRNKRGREGDI